MTNKLTDKDVGHLSKLANLPLTDSERVLFCDQVSNILENVEQIQQLDLSKLPETNQVTNKTNETRTDKVKPSLTQKQALSMANKTYKGFIVVPAVIDHDKD